MSKHIWYVGVCLDKRLSGNKNCMKLKNLTKEGSLYIENVLYIFAERIIIESDR